jgi:hypothetical protein
LFFFFISGAFLCQALLLFLIWDSFRDRIPKWMVGLALLLIGLRSPIMFMLNNTISARIYEAAISGGQFFLIAGFLLALSSFRAPSAWRPWLASCLWTLSVGTRLSLAAPIGVMYCLYAVWLLKTSPSVPKKIMSLAALGIPLMLGLACLGWYNWARFDSVTESGLYYQFASNNLQEHYDELMRFSYIPQNIYNYFLNPPLIDSRFPFFYSQLGRDHPLFEFHSFPDIYTSQLIAGLLYTEPFILYAVIPFVLALLGFHKKDSTDLNLRAALPWLTVTLGGSTLVAFGFLATFFWSAVRYAEDFLPSLMLLGIVGFWQGYSSLSERPAARGIYVGIGVLLAATSIIVSILLGLSVNDARFILLR